MEARKILMEEGRRTIADESYVGALVHKWGDFLEGMPDQSKHHKYVLGTMAMLMENQFQYLNNLNEEMRSVNVGSFTKFIFPVLRRVFPNLIANEIVSVQPMTAPVGAVFFLDYIYGTTKGATTEGAVFPRDFDKDYSSEFINGEPLVTGNGTDFGGGGATLGVVLAFTPVRPLDNARGFQVTIREISAADGSTVQEAIDDGAGAFTGDVTGGSVNYSNGSLTVFRFTNPPANGNQVKAFYFYDGELNTKIPQVNLDAKSPSGEM